MKQTIKKITKLTIVESFLQINFFKGYKYIDKAGEIVNFFHKGKEVPKFSMDLNGLTIVDPEDKIDSLRVSSNIFWTHFPLPDSLEIMDSYFEKKAESVVKIIEVEEIKRIGWRNYFVYEFETEESRDKVLKKFVPIKNLSLEEISLTAKCLEKNLTIRIRKVKKNDSEEASGILFDIDMYENYTELLSSNKISSKLKEFKEVIRSEDFLEIINNILGE